MIGLDNQFVSAKKVEGGIGIPPYLAMVLYSISKWFILWSFAFFLKAIHDIIRDVFIVYKNGSDYKVVGWQLIGKTLDPYIQAVGN